MKDLIKDIVLKLRNLYPELTLEIIIDDLEESLEKLGIEILYSDMGDMESDKTVSGFARVNSNTGQPEIVISGDEPKFRQRFTMAHELGHIILHWKWLPGISSKLDPKFAEITYRSDLTYTPEGRKREIEANEFAAELLLPLSEVKDFIADATTNDTILKHKLSEKYNVSLAMAKIQLEKARAE